MMLDPALAELSLVVFCLPQHFPCLVADTESIAAPCRS